MGRRYSLVFTAIAVTLIMDQAGAQSLDMLERHAAGKYRGIAGAAVALADGTGSVDLNPAGAADLAAASFSIGQSGQYYDYLLHRHNVGIRAGYFPQSAWKYNLEHVIWMRPVTSRISAGAGVVQKFNCFLVNVNRAITWSNMFDQHTHGSMYAAAVFASLRLSGHLSAGAGVYSFFGKTRSRIDGFFHGNDVNKWAELENSVSGLAVRAGLIGRSGPFSAGLAFEPPWPLYVKAAASLSADEQYAYLLPDYRRTVWHQPLILHAGTGYSGLRGVILSLDYEYRDYRSSTIAILLFEVGAPPLYRDIAIVRAGCQLLPGKRLPLPVRVGYARIPQLYTSVDAVGVGYAILDYEHTERLIKHVISAGTTVPFRDRSVHVALSWSFLSWQRHLDADHPVIDTYHEQCLTLSASIENR
ncbi:hypothetical protein JXO52_10340 [bacterium]|nr:hypothetical protein [bacterium]